MSVLQCLLIILGINGLAGFSDNKIFAETVSNKNAFIMNSALKEKFGEEQKANGQDKERKKLSSDQLFEKIIEKLRHLLSDEISQEPEASLTENRVSHEISREPITSPSATQLGAPSSTNQSTALVDRPSFSELLGLAFDNELLAFGEGTASVNLNLFAFLALANPTILDRQTKYGKYEFLRRFGASLSLGGKGDSFDRDGDGKRDEVLKAENLGDIVTWEVKFRLLGSRDRRDQRNFEKYKKAVSPIQDRFDAELLCFLDKHQEEMMEKDESGNFVFFEDRVVALLKKPEIVEELKSIADALKKMDEIIDTTNKKIDKRAIGTAFISRTNRDDEKYGPDRYTLGLRGVWGLGNWDNTFNLEWSRIERLHERPKGSEIKIAYESSTLWLKGSAISEAGITVGASVAAEFYNNIPDAKHDNIIKATVQLVYPISKAVSIPVSLTWANHRDILSDEDIVKGHIGLSIDLSKLHK